LYHVFATTTFTNTIVEIVLVFEQIVIIQQVTAVSNVWTFGIVMWEILEMGQRPYPNLSDAQVLDQVITGKTYVLEQPVNPYFSDKFLVNIYKDFMLPCLNYDPSTRPTISQVLVALSTPSSPA
jgi:serine/threonine protein kinase